MILGETLERKKRKKLLLPAGLNIARGNWFWGF
jgi:hypothetical protein